MGSDPLELAIDYLDYSRGDVDGTETKERYTRLAEVHAMIAMAQAQREQAGALRRVERNLEQILNVLVGAQNDSPLQVQALHGRKFDVGLDRLIEAVNRLAARV